MKTLTCALEIDAPAHEVWRVLTDSELIREWASAYAEGLAIHTNWKVGGKVSWRAPGGGVRASGRLTDFEPDHRLRFDYDETPGAAHRNFSETFEIQAGEYSTRLCLTTGPLDATTFNALTVPARRAIEEIRSLAEESAAIHRLR